MEHLETLINRTERCIWRPLWLENQILTTTAIQFDSGKSEGAGQRCREDRERLSNGEGAYGDTGIMEMD